MADGKVLGIGGVFLRADDPGKLSAWYREHLGFTVTAGGEPAPDGYWSWKQEAGETVFSFFPRGNSYFPTGKPAMINSIFGLVVVLVGAPIYFFYRQKRQM